MVIVYEEYLMENVKILFFIVLDQIYIIFRHIIRFYSLDTTLLPVSGKLNLMADEILAIPFQRQIFVFAIAPIAVRQNKIYILLNACSMQTFVGKIQ